MNLFSVILKLIRVLNLSDSEEYQLLHNDVKKWELEKAKEGSEDKLGVMYYKLHKGVWFRLAAPFLFYFAMKEIKNVMSSEPEGDDF